jgi:hypothetical protein
VPPQHIHPVRFNSGCRSTSVGHCDSCFHPHIPCGVGIIWNSRICNVYWKFTRFIVLHVILLACTITPYWGCNNSSKITTTNSDVLTNSQNFCVTEWVHPCTSEGSWCKMTLFVTRIHLDDPNSVGKQLHKEGMPVHTTEYKVLFWCGHERKNHITIWAWHIITGGKGKQNKP